MMKKKLNYNYCFLVYDVNESRNHKVFKLCKKYLSHFQNSVFRGEITPSNQIKLINELNNIIDKEEDFVCIIKTMNTYSFEEVIIGKHNVDGETLII
jgi:CRISPR-associated protein Cas2